MKSPKNPAASVRQRLLNRARSEGRPSNELLQYYAMERFLYRLSQTDYVNRYILKGALMLSVWRAPDFRPTMDIDLLGKTNNDEAQVVAQIRDILGANVEADGLDFDRDSLISERITEEAEYQGVRICFLGTLGVARINMQIDVGFGDPVFPEPELEELPTVLGHAAPRLYCYSRESAIAEIFQAMVKLGDLNSRMKDFYDIWMLSRQFDFVGAQLAESIRLTFERRGTTVPAELALFSDSIMETKQIQWNAYRKRLNQEDVPFSFTEVVDFVEGFLRPIAVLLSSGKPILKKWKAPGPWA